MDWKQITDRIRRFVTRQVADLDDAEDIVQDSLAVLFQSASVEDSVESVTSWLYRAAKNKIIDRYRGSARRKTASSPDLDNANAKGTAGPEQLLENSELWDELAEALEELPVEQREVFVWNSLDGLSFKEIALKTGENLNTLLSRKRYAVLHLRNRLRNTFENFKGDD